MTDTKIPEPAPRVAAFERRGYGLFLHWGLYSQLEQGEWFYHYHKPDPREYAERVRAFTAKDFDADALVSWARSVGFRYLCHTTRHHEGFSLYDTRGLHEFDITATPAGRDIVAEFTKACQKHDIGCFLYHTTLDWTHPDFHDNWDAYQQFLRDSVERLCTGYGKIDGFWFDGNWQYPERDWQEDALYAVIRKHQPEAIIVNNSSTQARGSEGHPETDVITFEQGRPTAPKRAGASKYRAAEMCDTINSHWGIAAGDYSHKNPAQVIENLCACRRFGANYLLNIGPTPDGALPSYEKALLDKIGAWVREQGTALFEGEPAPELVLKGRDFALRTKEGYAIYVHDLPIHGNMHLSEGRAPNHGWMTIAGKLPNVKSVSWADVGEELRFVQDCERGVLAFDATPHPYGRQSIVRVARIRV